MKKAKSSNYANIKFFTFEGHTVSRILTKSVLLLTAVSAKTKQLSRLLPLTFVLTTTAFMSPFAAQAQTSSPPIIKGITLQTNMVVTLSCSGDAGFAYLMQAATNLALPASWQTISTNVADTNGNWQFTDFSLTNTVYGCSTNLVYSNPGPPPPGGTNPAVVIGTNVWCGYVPAIPVRFYRVETAVGNTNSNAPTLTSISPTSYSEGADFDLYLYGSGFTTNCGEEVIIPDYGIIPGPAEPYVPGGSGEVPGFGFINSSTNFCGGLAMAAGIYSIIYSNNYGASTLTNALIIYMP